MKLRNILWVILALFVVLVGFRVAGRIMGGKKVQEERSVPVVLTTPKIGTIENKLTLTGDIKAKTEVSVRPRVAGRVEEIYVDEGDYVKAGDELLSFANDLPKDSEIYEDMVVRSPISGLIGMKLIKIGEQVTSQPGGLVNPVFVIYNIDQVKIYADVPEKNYLLVKEGLKVQIRPDALPDKIFEGRITNVRPIIDPMTRTTKVEIILPNPKRIIKPGMFSKVELVLQKKDKALIIPFDAVLGDGEKFVFVDENNIAIKKPVTIGIQQDNEVEVLSGLTKADKIITLGQRVVKQGSKIEEAKE